MITVKKQLQKEEDLAYRELGTAIVAQACEDYIYARRRQFQGKARSIDHKTISENVEFFNSDWCKLLLNNKANPKELVEALDKIAKTEEGRIIKLL